MKARELMTQNPSVVTGDEPVSRAAEIMRDQDVGIVPVVDDRQGMHLQGVITDRDLAVRCVAMRHGPQCRVRDHMTTGGLDTVTPDADVEEVMAKMRNDQLRRIPVVTDDNRLTGIIAQADLAIKIGPREPRRVEEVVEHISARA